MSVPRAAWLAALTLSVLTVLGPSLPVMASDFTRHKDLRNDYIKVTDIKERERTEERYAASDGKVTLQKLPYKEVMVTAELIQKPPSTMDTMFDAGADPYLKICMTPYDADGKAMDDDCQALRFQTLIRGNVGTASFRLSPETARYEFRVTQKLPDKGSSIKLWVPTD